MKNYTVILMLPDTISDAGDHSNVLFHIAAKSPVTAVGKAQKRCARQNGCQPNDLLPICVFEGTHEDLVGQWASRQ